VLVSRSARPLDRSIPGLLTVEGWAYAAERGAADAIARAADEGARVLGRSPGAASEAAVMAELQGRTLDAWSAFIEDLRVRPFVDQDESLLVSSRLSGSDSPLEALFREVWRQVGGADRSRGHDNQLAAAARFGRMISFVEQRRMDEISRIFLELNIALRGDDEGRSGRRLRARAASVRALQQAPRLVVQIVEDVVAQTMAGNGDLDRPPAARLWEAGLAAACSAALAGYPFAIEGPAADLAQARAMLAPGGELDSFFKAHLRSLMDIPEDGSPWRWKPDARLSGLRPESAEFFERTTVVGQALFPPEGVTVGFATIAWAFGQGADPTVWLGGSVSPDAWTPLAWPGREPGAGLRIHTGPGDRREWRGEWGLLEFLDMARLRPRDGGQRFRLDTGAGPSRIYLELVFNHAVNPASARPLLSGLTCPPTL
jgi:type VI protein secretion system component VasK